MTTHTPVSSSSSPAQYWLVKGQRALKEGQNAEALAAFRRAVTTDPYHVESLMWLAAHCDDPRESLRLITRVLALDPHYEAAHEGIRWARKRLQACESEEVRPTAPSMPAIVARAGVKPAPKPSSLRWAKRIIALCLVLAVLLSGGIVWALQLPIRYAEAVTVSVASSEPTQSPLLDLPESRLLARPQPPLTYAERADKLMSAVDVAWTNEDWAEAIPLIAQAIAFRPDDAVLKRKLMAAYFNHAIALIDDGELERALAEFDQALDVAPGDPQVQTERNTLANYIAGLAQYSQRNWAAATQWLTKVQSADAGYLETRGMLYRAYFYQGLDLKAQKDLDGALKAFQAAVNLDGNAIEARDELAKVKAVLSPPPPPAPGVSGEKWIDVNLTTQRFRAYQGQTVLYTFVTSTGENARPTQPGRYQVLDKIPNAYSRFWNLWMPYWMGIYWAGSSENGIHALPILSNGQKLWAGYLGRKVSFGCVILDTSAAKLMFEWADIGTPVIIHY